MNILVLSLLIHSIAAENSGESCSQDKNIYQKLKKKLFCNYDVRVRPVKDDSKAVLVNIELEFLKFSTSTFNTNRYVIISIGVNVSWTDENISWDKNDYDGITQVDIPPGKIWSPLITMDEAMHGKKIDFDNSKSYATNEGKILKYTERFTYIECEIYPTKWPNDKMECNLTTTIMHPPTKVKLVNNYEYYMSYDLKQLNEMNSAWEIIRVDIEPEVETTRKTYFRVSFIVKRRPSNMNSVVIIPVALAILMILGSFWINPLEQYRFILVTVSFFVHIIYIDYLAETIKGNRQKRVGAILFIQNSLIMCGVSMIILCINKGVMKSVQIPVWAKKVTDWAKHVITEVEVYNTDEADKNNEWIMVTAILDRIFFIVYFIFYFISYFIFIA